MNAAFRRRIFGAVFALVVVLFLVITIGQYNKSFSTFTTVTLVTDSAGASIPQRGDVKVRGALVGQVSEIKVENGQVALELALDPDKAKTIPAGVTARILPKTLFGERYIALQLPEGTGGPDDSVPHLVNGSRIETDTSGNAIELNRVLDSLLPLLEAVPPQKLQTTLGALSLALQGNGEKLKLSIEQLNEVFGGINSEMPALQEDLRSLAEVSDVYSDVLPDVINAVDTLRTTNTTVVEQQGELAALWSSLETGAGKTAQFLEDNREQIVTLSVDSEEVITLLGRYSPELGCTFENFAALKPEALRVVGHDTNQAAAHVSLIVTNPSGRYLPNQDEPRFFDTRGPACYPTDPPYMNYPGGPYNGGAYAVPRSYPGPQDNRFSTPEAQYTLVPGAEAEPGAVTADTPSLPSGAAARSENQAKIRAIVAAAKGIEPASIPDWMMPIYTMMFTGTEVHVQ